MKAIAPTIPKLSIQGKALLHSKALGLNPPSLATTCASTGAATNNIPIEINIASFRSFCFFIAFSYGFISSIFLHE